MLVKFIILLSTNRASSVFMLQEDDLLLLGVPVKRLVGAQTCVQGH